MMLHSITATYPDFQALPKGVKQMLVVSESVFFEEARSLDQTEAKQGKGAREKAPAPVEAIHLVHAGRQYESPGVEAGG